MDSADQTALRALRDKQAIHEALMRYCRGVDRADAALITSSMHPDALIDTGVWQLKGSEAGEKIANALRDGKGSMHFAGNEYIEVDGDVAFAETYMLSYLVTTKDGKDYTRVRGSRYIDRFERRSGEWKTARRVVVDDWTRTDEIVGARQGGHRLGGKYPDDAVYLMRAGKL